jgi:CRISPR/Cas system-associated exonuclease Cas4 (RecB family)
MEELSPVQQEVVAQIGALRESWPEFPAELRGELRGELERGVADHVKRLGDGVSIWANKHAITSVHGCEKKFLADREFPGWSVPLARGSVVHKAIELSINWRGTPIPADLVDESMASLEYSEQNISSFLQELPDADRAQLRSDSVDLVTKFDECWPDLKKQWRPVTESKIRMELFDGVVVLQGKIDLTLGRAEGLRAGKVLVDLKSGKFQPGHMHDLRYYAMIETVRIGVPPRRIASYYLDQGRFHSEDVTEEMLFSSAQRAIDGINRMIELELDASDPRVATSPACRWCRVLDTCQPGQVSLREFDDPLEDLL